MMANQAVNKQFIPLPLGKTAV